MTTNPTTPAQPVAPQVGPRDLAAQELIDIMRRTVRDWINDGRGTCVLSDHCTEEICKVIENFDCSGTARIASTGAEVAK